MLSKIIFGFFKLLFLIILLTAAYQWWRPVPAALTIPFGEHLVSNDSVHFFADYTFTDKDGVRQNEGAIWSNATALMSNARHYMLIDLFQFNDFRPQDDRATSSPSNDFVTKLVDALMLNRHMAVALITDPINTLYGGISSPQETMLRAAGVIVIYTDLSMLRDSDLLYSSIWRICFSWWGNAEEGGWLPAPIHNVGTKVTLRTWLNFLNMKANERSIILADKPVGKKVGAEGAHKMITFVTSADHAGHESADGNVALQVDDGIWKDVIESERRVAEMSGAAIVGHDPSAVTESAGDVHVRLLPETQINETLVNLLAVAKRGDTFDIATTYLSSRELIGDIINASNNGATIRLILDPNRGGWLDGIPNGPAAKEIMNKSISGVTVRWCDTHGEQCRGNYFSGQTASSSFLVIGSANLTRRDLGGYNLETDVIAWADKPFQAWLDGKTYFDRLWDSKDGIYTVPYETFSDNSVWKSSVYRMMERTGISTF